MTNTTPNRRALLVTTDDEPVLGVAEDLAAAGYEVRRCHAGGVRFPCVGLAGEGCPLEADGGVDVAVDVRQHPWPDPTALEVGVTCALRDGVPLVVICSGGHPFEPWAVASSKRTDAIASRCEQAIHDALEPHRAAAAAAVRSVFANHEMHDTDVEVEVQRRQNRLHVTITADAPDLVKGLAAARAASALRRIDRAATAMEIDVTPQR